jgi:hypothetical protein
LGKYGNSVPKNLKMTQNPFSYFGIFLTKIIELEAIPKLVISWDFFLTGTL